jgi:hypothetical protein
MNNLFTTRTQLFTNNGIVRTTASNAPFPDPLGGSMFYSILVQNLISNFSLAGTGTFLQAGANPGNTVFNDFTRINLLNGTNFTFASTNPGSFTNFFTRQIVAGGTGPVAVSLKGSNISGFNFDTNLPSFGPGDVAFLSAPSATSAVFRISGAPVAVGFTGSPPPSIPALQQPVSNFTIGPKVSLIANRPVSISATNSVNIFGNLIERGTAGPIVAQSPVGSSLNVGGRGTFLSSQNIFASTSPGTNVNFAGHTRLLGPSILYAPNGAVTIGSGSTVRHNDQVTVNSPSAVPPGFVPNRNIVQKNTTFPIPSNPAINIVTPNLNVGGRVVALPGI